MKKKGIVYLIIVFIFLYTPIAVSILFSFNSSNSMAVFEGFSLDWYKELFTNEEAIDALVNSLILAVSSSAIATIIGTMAALGIYHMKNKHAKNAVMFMTDLPMMNPDIITGVALMLLFAFIITFTNINAFGFPAMLISHVTFNLPYVILCIVPKLKQMDKNLPEAAMDLGCTPFEAFFKVEIFEILPGILSGLMLAFTLSLDDFVISYFVSGESFQTLPIYIYSQTKRRVSPDMNALFAIIFVVILLIVFFVLRGSLDEKVSDKKKQSLSKGALIRRTTAIVVCFAIVFGIAAMMIFGRFMVEDSDFEVTEETASIDYSAYEGVTINVYNWGEYIPDGSEGSLDLNEEFERLTGIHVNYTNYASNEDMYAKLISGGVSYDIVVPSDYMIDRLRSEGLIQKINFDNIPNYKNISDDYKNLYYDPDNEYSVPYTGGTVVLIYNTEIVETIDNSWEALRDPELSGQILMFNNPRDGFAIAQFALGIDINDPAESNWENAKKWLVEQKKYVKAYVMDEVFNKMESGSAAVAPYYAGDFITMYENNNSLDYVYPKEGTNFFCDAMCIPTNARHKEAAELYINFMLDANVGTELAEYMYYATPNQAVRENEEYIEYMEEIYPGFMELTYPDFETLYPGKDKNDFFFHGFDTETNEMIAEKWTALKIAATDESNNAWLYISCLVCIAVIAALIIHGYIKKIRRRHV